MAITAEGKPEPLSRTYDRIQEAEQVLSRCEKHMADLREEVRRAKQDLDEAQVGLRLSLSRQMVMEFDT
jgi:hypothetical protein